MFTVRFKYLENETAITFPCDESHMLLKLSSLGAKSKLDTRQYVIGTDCDYLKCFETDFVDIDELNFLAKRLDSFIKEEQDIFEALVEVKKAETVAELINLTYNIHNYTLIQDISSLEKIGEKHFKDVQVAWMPEEYEKADLKKMGRELMASSESKVTNKGLLFEHNDSKFVAQYNGENFPEFLYGNCDVIAEIEYKGRTEYVYMPEEPLAIEKALKRLGAEKADKLNVSLDNLKVDDKIWSDILKDIVRTEDIHAVNEVVNTVHNFSDNNEINKLINVIEFAGRTDSKSILKLANNLDEFRYYAEATNEEDLGRALIKENEEYFIHEDIEDFFMYEQYAESVIRESDVKFTDGGIVILGGKTLEEILSEDIQGQELNM